MTSLPATSTFSRLSAALPFWLSLGLVPLAVFAAMHGGWTILLLPISTWYLFTGLDFVVGLDTKNPDPATPESQLFWYKLITWVWPPILDCLRRCGGEAYAMAWAVVRRI